MNLIAAIFNITLFLFTCLQIINRGVSDVPIYIILTLLLLLVPILNLIMILSGARNSNWYSFHVKRHSTNSHSNHEDIPYMDTFIKVMVLTFNCVLFGISCWAIVDQYPHSKDDGVLIFTLIVLLTPIISLLTISRNHENIGHYA
jgi:hypothetical protein